MEWGYLYILQASLATQMYNTSYMWGQTSWVGIMYGC